MTWVPRLLPRLMLLPLTVLLAVCGDGDKNPAAPPTPIPAPTPAPTPVVQTNCERIGFGTGSGTGCPREAPTFLKEVEAAIDRVGAEHPNVVSGDRVLSIGQYYVFLVENLEKAGLCADFDGEEIQVKNSNAFNDQYHVMTSQLLLQRGQKAYRSTCYPAAFPTPAPPLPDTPGCSLKPSKEKACGRESPAFLAQVDAAIQKVADELPGVLDKSDIRGGPNWYRIVNADAYLEGVVRNLNAVGLCARWDGHEMAVKNENRFSDQYDIIAGEGYTRRGAGSYRTTCYPAAF